MGGINGIKCIITNYGYVSRVIRSLCIHHLNLLELVTTGGMDKSSYVELANLLNCSAANVVSLELSY